MHIKLPQQIEKALTLLHKQTYPAYIVGGCVRDTLLGKHPNDWDITTAAPPGAITACFETVARVIPTGLRHGTVTVILDGVSIEITTFRVDGDYTDSRRPDNVRFTGDLTQDLARRDFTVNAIAYSARTGLVDPFGGQEDLARGVLRCVGDPDTRFCEDALRILRGLRFCAQHGFTLEPASRDSLLRNRALLRRISAERVQQELSRLLCGAHVDEVLRAFHAVLEVFIPELKATVGFLQHNPPHLYDVFEHTVRAVECVGPDVRLRLAALLHDIGKPDCFSLDGDGVGHFYGHTARSAAIACDILARLRFDSRTKECVAELVARHDVHIPPEEAAVRRWLRRLGEERLRLLLRLKRADCGAQGTHHERLSGIDAISALLDSILESGECVGLSGLAVNGRDILALGVPAGPQVGRVLEVLLESVVNGSCENERNALLDQARRQIGDIRT